MIALPRLRQFGEDRHFLQGAYTISALEGDEPMSLFSEVERPVAEGLGRLVNTNPFLPDWVEWECRILGVRFQEAPAVYSRQAFWEEGYLHPNVEAIGE